MMLSRQSQEQSSKYVHFTNGFPPKELVPAQGLSSSINMHGGFFVGLHEEATSKLTKSQRTIPPLAKGRANYYSVRHRASSSRYREKRDPFDAHKGTEKTGFTPQVIKHSKPKIGKTSPRNEQTTTRIPSSSLNPSLGLKLPRQTVCPISTLLHGGSEVISRNPNEANNRVLSDVEKEITQGELLGIDEVYKRVCNGSMESLHSLISPVKGKPRAKQASNMKYIQTSSPLSLNTKPLKTSQSDPAEGESESEVLPENDDKNLEKFNQGLKDKMSKNSILVPLPYFTSPSRPPYTAPARYTETCNRPKIHAPRIDQKQRFGAYSSLSGWSSPSVINFNAADLPQLSRPATRSCGPTGSIIGVQNKSQTGKVAIVAAVGALGTATPPVTPPATATSEFYQHEIGLNNTVVSTTNRGRRDDGSPEVDSLCSDGSEHSNTKGNNAKSTEKKTSINSTMNKLKDKDTSELIKRDENVKDNDKVKDLSTSMSGMNVMVTLNVIDEAGSVNDVEIYHPENRDLQKQEQVTKEIQEAQENYQKRKQEIETLLEEHESLVHEVNDLSKDLKE